MDCAPSLVAVVKIVGKSVTTCPRSDSSHVEGHGGGPKGPQMPGCCVTVNLTAPLGTLASVGARWDAMMEQVAPIE